MRGPDDMRWGGDSSHYSSDEDRVAFARSPGCPSSRTSGLLLGSAETDSADHASRRADESTPWITQGAFGFSTADSASGTAGEDSLELMICGKSLEEIQSLIDAEAERIAILDSSWNFLVTNKAWQRGIEGSDFCGLVPGVNQIASLEKLSEVSSDATAILLGIRYLTSIQGGHFAHVYAESSAFLACSYRSSDICFDREGRRLYLIICRQCRPSHGPYPQSAEVVARAQELERRRIGREIHDSTSQLLIGLQLCLLRMKGKRSPTDGLITEMEDILSDIHREVRAISYTLHLPPLQKHGLTSSLETMIRGFASRTGLNIDFHVEGRTRPASTAAEATLYRMAQEALANVFRHARAQNVEVRLVARHETIHLLVRDDGIGIGNRGDEGAVPSGVGIAGMRARLEELGGRLTIGRPEIGTVMIATLPATRPEGPRLEHSGLRRRRSAQPRPTARRNWLSPSDLDVA
jgi:signal transduction histidine kinase